MKEIQRLAEAITLIIVGAILLGITPSLTLYVILVLSLILLATIILITLWVLKNLFERDPAWL